VVLMTNVFDDVNARIVGDHLANVVGRHLPLGVFVRDHDIFALADSAPEQGPDLYRGAAAASLLTGASASSPACACAESSRSTSSPTT
jgi:hypothetical protein